MMRSALLSVDDRMLKNCIWRVARSVRLSKELQYSFSSLLYIHILIVLVSLYLKHMSRGYAVFLLPFDLA